MREPATKPTPDAAERDRYVFVARPHCPRCDGTGYRVYGHDPAAEPGTQTQYARCLNIRCGHKFKIIWE